MAEKPAPQIQPQTSAERVRHVPEWEVPANPPKRSFLSRLGLPGGFRGFKPAPKPTFAQLSNESLHKQRGTKPPLLPTTNTPLTGDGPPPPVPPLPRDRSAERLPERKRPNKITRWALIGFIVFFILALALGLGLGLGLGLRGRGNVEEVDLPLPENGQRIYQGDLTFYEPGLGACGYPSSSTDLICAVGHELFDAAGANAASGGNPNLNPLCGLVLRVRRDFFEEGVGNVTVDVAVVDRCTDCGPMDLDLSPGVFELLALKDSGRVRGEWEWVQ